MDNKIEIIESGQVEWSQDGKKVVKTYDHIKAPEATLNGKRGKYTSFGFVVKPGTANNFKRDNYPIGQPKPKPEPMAAPELVETDLEAVEAVDDYQPEIEPEQPQNQNHNKPWRR